MQVKIGSPNDFIGSVKESVLTREAKDSTSQRTGSLLGQSHSPSPQSPSVPPVNTDVVETTSDGLAAQNFMNFVENSFEQAVLIEQHLVKFKHPINCLLIIKVYCMVSVYILANTPLYILKVLY